MPKANDSERSATAPSAKHPERWRPRSRGASPSMTSSPSRGPTRPAPSPSTSGGTSPTPCAVYAERIMTSPELAAYATGQADISVPWSTAAATARRPCSSDMAAGSSRPSPHSLASTESRIGTSRSATSKASAWQSALAASTSLPHPTRRWVRSPVVAAGLESSHAASPISLAQIQRSARSSCAVRDIDADVEREHGAARILTKRRRRPSRDRSEYRSVDKPLTTGTREPAEALLRFRKGPLTWGFVGGGGRI